MSKLPRHTENGEKTYHFAVTGKLSEYIPGHHTKAFLWSMAYARDGYMAIDTWNVFSLPL